MHLWRNQILILLLILLVIIFLILIVIFLFLASLRQTWVRREYQRGMKMTETFNFEELDDTTQTYLREARDTKGCHLPGVFAPHQSYLPWFGFFGGLAIIIGAFWYTLPPLDEPLK